MISNELLEEIIFLSKQGKLIDKKLALKIVLQIISNTDKVTKKNFSGLTFTKQIKSYAEANIDQGRIFINFERCYSELSKLGGTTLDSNLWILTTILHEIEHLKEPYKIRTDNFEGRLINISNYVYNTNLRDKLYFKNPSEKIAYALSYKNLLDCLSNYPNFKKENFKEFKSINDEYITKLKFGYKKQENGKYNSSLIDFMAKLQILDCLEYVGFKLVKSGEQKNINKLSLEQKFMYGLPVSEEDVKKLNRKKRLIIK